MASENTTEGQFNGKIYIELEVSKRASEKIIRTVIDKLNELDFIVSCGVEAGVDE